MPRSRIQTSAVLGHRALLLLMAAAACQTPTDAPAVPDRNPPEEVIVPSVPCATDLGRFGGFQWQARSQGLSGPGPNTWSACNAWLDAAGLHLRLNRTAGTWTSAEVYTTGVVGYGRVEFEIATPLDALDPNVVFGLFTYPGGTLDGQHEIDIEFARFGATAATATNLNYVVYPGAPLSGAKGLCSLRWDTSVGASVHRFLWSPDAVGFQSFAATAVTSATTPYRAWRFAPSGAFTVSHGTWPLHVNLWLYGGKAPVNGASVEIVIRRVTYDATLPSTTVPSTICR